MVTHTFRQKRFRIVESSRIKFDGYCDWRDTKDKKLWLKKGMEDRKRLEVMLHEGLHACLSSLDEDAVSETARDLAAFLWRDGWCRLDSVAR